MYKVLIVDDEQMIKKSLVAMLQWVEADFQVVGEADNGSDALRMIGKLMPDLIITDINMPVMDGLELIKKARALGYEGEFVILTGYGYFEYAQKALRYRVSDYLLKPIKPDEFMQYLDQFKEKHEAIKQEEGKRDYYLQVHMPIAQQIAVEMWQLNEIGMQTCLKTLEQSNMTDFRDIYNMVIGCLKELASNDDELELLQAESDLLSLEALEVAFVAIISSIREKRNWGQRRSIQAAADYIDEHFSNNQLSLLEVANHVQMSPSYFSRSFKEALGVNFIQYMTKLRMEKAKLLLEQEELKTYEVAFEVGYTDYPHFSKAFKKYSGLSPSEFRRNMGRV